MRKSIANSTRPPLPSSRHPKATTLILSDSLHPSSDVTNHMTQTDLSELLIPERPSDPLLLTWKTRRRVRGLQAVSHRKSSSVPEDLGVNFVLTPLETSRLSSQQDSRNRFDPLISRMCCSVRGSGFRQQTAKMQVPPSYHTISLRRKLHTLVKGRRLVLSATTRSHRVSMCEATTLTESP